MLNKLYIKLSLYFLRKKLGLKKFEQFRFKNQKSKVNSYYFNNEGLTKIDNETCSVRPSNVKLNYLLSDHCKIVKVVNNLCEP